MCFPRLSPLQAEIILAEAFQGRHPLRLAHDGIIFEFFTFSVFQRFMNGTELGAPLRRRVFTVYAGRRDTVAEQLFFHSYSP